MSKRKITEILQKITAKADGWGRTDYRDDPHCEEDEAWYYQICEKKINSPDFALAYAKEKYQSTLEKNEQITKRLEGSLKFSLSIFGTILALIKVLEVSTVTICWLLPALLLLGGACLLQLRGLRTHIVPTSINPRCVIKQLEYHQKEKVQTQLAASYAITNDGFKFVSDSKANALDRSIMLLVFAMFWSGAILVLSDVVWGYDHCSVFQVPVEGEVGVEADCLASENHSFSDLSIDY